MSDEAVMFPEAPAKALSNVVTADWIEIKNRLFTNGYLGLCAGQGRAN